jgi:hypothetical protein
MNEPHDPQTPAEPESDVVELIRSIDVRAPDSLHATIDAMISERSGRTRRSSRLPLARRRFAPRLAAVGSILAAVVALVIVVALGSSSSTLSVHDAAALTLRAATGPAPAESPKSDGQLAASVEGVAFPYWSAHFDWRATGQRSDKVDGREITTVFYENPRGRRVGYSIVAGSKPPPVTGGVISRSDGTPYRLLTVAGAAVVAWTREGHLCVISGHGVDGATLLRLASWDNRRALAS